MSLVLIAKSDSEILVCSDGAVKLVQPDGSSANRHITNYRKFRVFTQDIIIAATGESWFAEERVYPAVEKYLTENPPCKSTFRELTEFLGAHVEEWDRERAERLGERKGATNGYCLALIGIDRVSNRARAVIWADALDHEPNEITTFAAFGFEAAAHHAMALMGAARDIVPIEEWHNLLPRIINEVANSNAEVGGSVFVHTAHGSLPGDFELCRDDRVDHLPAHQYSGSTPLIDTKLIQHYIPLYTQAGGIKLYDPAAARLEFDMGASDGTSGNKGIPKGMKSGTARNQQAVTFSPAFNTPPTVRFSGGLSDQLDAKWGNLAAANASSGNGNGTTPRPTTGSIKQVMSADSLSASGFTASLVLAGGGAPTNNTANFAAPTTVTAVGNSTGAGDPTTQAYDGNYRATYDIVWSSGASPILGTGVIALMMSIDNGAYVEVASNSYHYVLGISDSLTWSGEVLTGVSLTVDGTNDHFQLKVKSATNGPTISLTVAAGALAWSTSGTPTYASMTPNGIPDAVAYFAVAAS